MKAYCENQKDSEELRSYISPLQGDGLCGWYEYFLDEGDYEQWQKFCYMEDCPEKRRAHLKALWILQRFNLFGSMPWTQLGLQIHPLFQAVKEDQK